MCASEPPAWLPHYDLAIRLDTDAHLATVTERVTWTNHHQSPAKELVFNAHAHYAIPDKDIGLLAKTLELLRMAPSEAMSFAGPPLEVKQASLIAASLPKNTPQLPDELPKTGDPLRLPPPHQKKQTLQHQFAPDNDTALVLPLPHEVGPGESVTVEMEFVMKLPPKKGRWGQWAGITTLAQWLPVLAIYDDKGWQPTPFIPWHQPFYNEAGHYTARITLPADQKLACTAIVQQTKDLRRRLARNRNRPDLLRDFALIASARFRRIHGPGRQRPRSLPGSARTCLPRQERGAISLATPSPFTTNGSGRIRTAVHLGRILFRLERQRVRRTRDARRTHAQHAARHLGLSRFSRLPRTVPSMVVQRRRHQRLCRDLDGRGPGHVLQPSPSDQKLGKNNKIIAYPNGLGWMPNINREDFRNYGYIGMQARGDDRPDRARDAEVQAPRQPHVRHAYDRGSKIVGMIEQRMGEAAFFDFSTASIPSMAIVCCAWPIFKRNWKPTPAVRGTTSSRAGSTASKMTDWAVHKVEVDGLMVRRPFHKQKPRPGQREHLAEQRGDISEPTVLGIRLAGQKGYQIRVAVAEVAEAADIARNRLHASNGTVRQGGKCRS